RHRRRREHEPVRDFLPRRRHRSLERRSRRHLAAAFTCDLPFRRLAQPGAGKTLELHRVDTDHPQDDGQAHVSADAGRTGRGHAAVEPAARIAAESGRGAHDVTFARRIRRAPFGALSRVINCNCGSGTAVGVLSLACPRASTQREDTPRTRTNFARAQGETAKDKGLVDLCPVERARQDAEPWLSSIAGSEAMKVRSDGSTTHKYDLLHRRVVTSRSYCCGPLSRPTDPRTAADLPTLRILSPNAPGR